MNKKVIAGILCANLMIFQAGCLSNEINKPVGGPNNEKVSTSAGILDQDTEKKKIIEALKELENKGVSLSELITFTDKHISSASQEGAVMMVTAIEQAQKKNLPTLEEKFYKGNNIQNKLNQVYKPGFDLNKVEDIKDKELRELLTETRDMGYRIETAEGSYFPIINYEFYKRFSAGLPSDFKEYIEIMAIESNQVPAKDAALVIGWEEILKRAVRQEKFLNTYGASLKAADIKQLLKKYTTFVLLGANNTPLFTYDTKQMVPKAKDAYLNAIKVTGESKTLNTVRELMEMLKSSDYKLTESIDKFRKNAVDAIK